MSSKSPPTVSCPTCGRPVPFTPENPYRPFCCARCKLIDMGQWAAEKYRVPDEDGGNPPPEEG